MGVGRARAACPRQGHRFSSSLPIPLLAGEADPVAAATGFQPQEEGERTMAYTRYKGDPYWKRAKVGGTSADGTPRSEEHTSELQSLMRISYAVFCLKKKKKHNKDHTKIHDQQQSKQYKTNPQ